MPGTEDIAEKVGDLLIEQTARAGAYVLDNAPIVKDGVVRGSSQITGKIVKRVRDGSANHRLKEFEKQGSKLPLTEFWSLSKKLNYPTDTMKIADGDSKEFENLLRKEQIAFTALDNTTDNYTVFVFFRKDAEKVKRAKEGLMAHRGQVTELSPKMFMDALDPDKVTVLENVDSVRAELFRYFAREHGLLFAYLPETDNRSGQVLYQSKDAVKARQTMLSVGWALTSEGGAKVLQQVQHYLRGRNSINRSIEEGNKELYIVSKTNPSHMVRITEKEMTLYKNGQEVHSIDRMKPDFYTHCMEACEAIPNGVVLTADEYKDPHVMANTLANMPTLDLFPPDTVEVTEEGYVNNLYDGFDPIREQARINRLYDLVSRKMNLDNEGNSGWGAFDSSVSFSEFAGDEAYRDTAEWEGREAEFEHFKKAAFYSNDHFHPEEIDMTDRSIDYVISRAYKRAGYAPEPEQEAPIHEPGGQNR